MNDDHRTDGNHRGLRWRLRRRRPSQVPLKRFSEIDWIEPGPLENGNGRKPGGADDLDGDAALVERLRSMELPKPSDEARERGLRAILARMEESATRDKGATNGGRAHGVEQRHSFSRVRTSHRPTLTLSDRPLRRAIAL